MKKFTFKWMLLVSMVCWAVVSTANATTFTNWYGDNDGCGGQATETGEVTFWDPVDPDLDVRGANDPSNTDRWTYKSELPLVWTHTFSEDDLQAINNLNDNTSVTLEIASAGLENYGEAKVYVCGNEIGGLTQNSHKNINTFDISNYLVNIIDSSDLQVYVRKLDGTGAFPTDNWILDYSKITFCDDKPLSVPEPSVLLLMSSGVLAFGTVSRRLKKRQK